MSVRSKMREVWRQVRREDDSEKVKMDEKPSEDIWGVDGLRGARRMTKAFDSVLAPRKDFPEWAEHRQEAGLPTNVVEFFGGAYMFPEPEKIDSLLGVRFTNVDEELIQYYTEIGMEEFIPLLKHIMEADNRTIFEGNLLSFKTWEKIFAYQREVAPEGFDLIIIRPIAGLDRHIDIYERHPKELLSFYFQLLRHAYRILSPNEGQIFLQIPVFMRLHRESPGSRTETALTKYLLNVEGLMVEHEDHGIFKITKTTQSPAELPLLV